MQFQFEEGNRLGRGRYGFVFPGTLTVAVKKVEIPQFEDNAREVYALRRCDHPNVIELFHVYSEQNFRYYLLELCRASLDQLFLEETDQRKYYGPMPPTKKDVCLQLAEGMEHIHQNELIHGDVKPANVLIWVHPTGERVLMKWADFDSSKPVNEREIHFVSGRDGSEGWRAPESHETGPNRPTETVKSDVFCEGLVFGYYLLGGFHPFRGQHGREIPHNIVNNRVNLSGIDKNHPMRSIIMDMFNTDPVKRISSSEVVARISAEWRQ